MNEEKKRFSPPTVGGSSLLVIFAVLCLTVFALLSLSTVQADDRLGRASAEAVSGYYEADTRAEAILARLRGGERLEGVDFATSAADPGRTTVSYACAISETQALRVRVVFPNGLGDDYEIEEWQAVSTADWEPEDGITVWDGETFE